MRPTTWCTPWPVPISPRDRAGAHAFSDAATNAGLSQIIYLGGLGDDNDDLSEHLRSRREVEAILMDSAPTTALRAGIVIGDGGISWEILRQLVLRLPVMVTPRWVETRTQPIALADALGDLTSVLGHSGAIGETFEIGGPAPLTYRTMMVTVSRLMGLRRTIIPVPFLSPRLSSHWLRLITDVDLTTARALVDSMTNEVIVRDHRIETLLGPYAAALRGGGGGCIPPQRRSTWPGDRESVRITDLLDPAPSQQTPGPHRRCGDSWGSLLPWRWERPCSRPPCGKRRFVLVATCWVSWWRPRRLIGARVSGPVQTRPTRPSPHVAALWALAIGGLSFLGFLAADLIGQHISFVSSDLHSVLARADTGPRAIVLVVALVNGLAEEAFFRGALYWELSAHRPVFTSTTIYVVVTAATANVALIVAAAVMGVIFALERRVTGGVYLRPSRTSVGPP